MIFWPALSNSVVITMLSVLGQVLSCSLVGFWFARFRFRGRGILFMVILSTMMLHAPVTIAPPPTIAEIETQAAGDVSAIESRFSRNTRPTNYLGLPALSVPAGFSSGGLPIAFQVMGRPFSEALLFRVAHLYQQETDWHIRVPQL